MEKKSFIFYTSWKKNIEMMEDDELRRFINNLINHTEGNEINLPTRMEKMLWNDLVEVLNHNERKREMTAERSRQNGLKGGRPQTQNNPVGFNKTQQVNEKPSGLNNNPENLLMGNGKLEMGNGKKLLGVMKQLIDEGITSKEDVENLNIQEVRGMLTYSLPNVPDWEEKLNKCGYNGFCLYLKDNKVEVDYILSAQIKAFQLL